MAATTKTSMDRPIELLREEFESLPGMRLTLPQVARLLTLDPREAALVLERLEAEGLLLRDDGVAYRRSASMPPEYR